MSELIDYTAKKDSNTELLDFLLNDILNQIKITDSDQKDAPYAKLIELFFKGLDLKEKIASVNSSEVVSPSLNIISGIDSDKI